MKLIGILALTTTLAACAGSPFETRMAMAHSRDAYKSCVASKGAAGCDAELAIYNADVAAAGQSPMPVVAAPAHMQTNCVTNSGYTRCW